jgi:hypothetical protein
MPLSDNASILSENDTKITRIARHAQGGEYYKGVIFPTPDGPSDERFIPYEITNDSRALKTILARGGMRFPSDKAMRAKLFDAIAQYEPPERCVLTGRTGWHDDTYVLPHTTISPAGSDDIIYHGNTDMPGQPTAGTLEEWGLEVGSLLGASTLGVFTTVVSLAPVIASIVNLENAMFHISGKSGVGKTTLVRTAASVWAGGHRSVESWDTTALGLQEMMERRNDGFACFDEFSASAADSRSQRQLLITATYMLATGMTRRRSQHFMGSTEVQSYRFLGLSTGETTAASIAAAAGDKRKLGEEARFLDLPVPEAPTGIFDRLTETDRSNKPAEAAKLADSLNLASGRYFGTVSHAFIRYVVDNREYVEQEVQTRVTLFNKNLKVPVSGWERRISGKFALAYAAGVLATEAGILPWSQRLVRDCCIAAYHSARSHLKTEEDMTQIALKRLQQIAKDAIVIDSTTASAPSVSNVDAAPAIRMKKRGKTSRIFVKVSAFRTIGDKTVRERLVRQLGATGIWNKPEGYPRVKAFQVIAIKGARRQSYMSFDKRLITY